MYCPSCGNKVDDSSAFCSSCGSRLSVSANDNLNIKSKNSRNGWIVTIVVLLVLILVSIFVLGFTLYSQNNDKSEREESIEYDRDTDDDRNDNKNDGPREREDEDNDSNFGYTEEEIEESRERADKDVLDSVYKACTVAYSDPEWTQFPSVGEVVSEEMFQSTDWGRAVLETLGVSSFSDVEKKLKSQKAAGEKIVIYLNENEEFTVSAGSISVP